MSWSLRVRAHAKVNLVLRVGAPGDDGYHPVATVLQTVSLADRLYFGVARPPRSVPTGPGGPAPLDVSVRGASLPGDNTLTRAAGLVAGRLRERGVSSVPALEVELDKRIPIGAGLGGGSSDGAATLLACARLWGSLDIAELEELARRIGADAPFFLRGGTALGTGRGDELEGLEPLERRWVVVVAPRLQVGTAEAYAAYDRLVPDPGPPRRPDYRPRPDDSWMGNDLEPVVERLFPAVAEARRALAELCPGPVRMTGSGAASFGVFAGRRPATRAARSLRGRGWWAEACVTVDRERHLRALGGSGC